MSQPDDQWEEKFCNSRLIGEVAEEQDLYIHQVEGILKHYSDFIARTIRSGSMEGVFVPYLGKFQVKHKNQQYKAYFHTLHPAYRKLFQQSSPEQVEHIFTIQPAEV